MSLLCIQFLSLKMGVTIAGERRTVGAGEEASGMRVELSRGSFLALLILNNQYHKQSGILHVERS
jgi:hypothetical protein